jgi:hypothetical protein
MIKNIALLGIVAFVACAPSETEKVEYKTDVQAVLNDWHNAAAEADFERYFGHFENEHSIFMGTDATERWNLIEFKEFSKPYFDRGRAWSFTPVSRYVYLSENGKIAWFDEKLSTPNLGPSRGTGVMVLKDGNWKIAHYNLTVPIPNAIVGDVVEQIEEELTK